MVGGSRYPWNYLGYDQGPENYGYQKEKKATSILALLQTVTGMLQSHNLEAVLITCLAIEFVGNMSINNSVM